MLSLVRQNLSSSGSGLCFEFLQNEDAFWFGLQAPNCPLTEIQWTSYAEHD